MRLCDISKVMNVTISSLLTYGTSLVPFFKKFFQFLFGIIKGKRNFYVNKW